MTAVAWPGLLGHEFARNAIIAGGLTAVSAGLVGWFVVLRNQVFAADALSHVAFTGGLGALAYGFGAGFGVYAGTIGLAVVLGLLGGRLARAGDTVTGIVFAWVLGIGAYFLSVFVSGRSSGDSTAAVRVLFGSLFGIGSGQVRVTAWVTVLTVGGLLLVARPLLFATVDPEVARAEGVPVQVVEVIFLALLGLAVAQAVQVVGTLLLLALVATPAAAAQRLTTRPWAAMWLSAGIALGGVWAGIVISYLRADVPPSFVIVSLVVGVYLATFAVRLRR
ncbi:MAG: metal ABC transporter permease [Actinobacteria bacterium]|nr:metal ABC transporter permease [Actinomycetota bacterium]